MSMLKFQEAVSEVVDEYGIINKDVIILMTKAAMLAELKICEEYNKSMKVALEVASNLRNTVEEYKKIVQESQELIEDLQKMLNSSIDVGNRLMDRRPTMGANG